MFGTFMEAQNVPVLKILMVMKILFIFIFIFTLYKGKYKELILHVIKIYLPFGAVFFK